MKYIIATLFLVAFASAMPLELHGEEPVANNVTDFTPYISLLTDVLKKKIADDGGFLKIPQIKKDFSYSKFIITIHNRVELDDGKILGLESLKPTGSNTMTTTNTSLEIRANIGAEEVKLSFTGRVGPRVFGKYHFKRLGVIVDLTKLSFRLDVTKDLLVKDAKPEIKQLTLGDFGLKVKLSTHLGILSKLADPLVNFLAKYFITHFNLKVKIPELLKPLLQTAISKIDLPI